MIHLSSFYIFPFEDVKHCILVLCPHTCICTCMYLIKMHGWHVCDCLKLEEFHTPIKIDAFEFLGLNICLVFWPKEPHIKWTICSTINSVLVTEKAANLVTKLLNWATFKYLSLRTCVSACIIFVLFSWTTLKIFIAAKRIHTIIKLSTEQTLNITNNFLSNNFLSLFLFLSCPTPQAHSTHTKHKDLHLIW